MEVPAKTSSLGRNPAWQHPNQQQSVIKHRQRRPVCAGLQTSPHITRAKHPACPTGFTNQRVARALQQNGAVVTAPEPDDWSNTQPLGFTKHREHQCHTDPPTQSFKATDFLMSCQLHHSQEVQSVIHASKAPGCLVLIQKGRSLKLFYENFTVCRFHLFLYQRKGMHGELLFLCRITRTGHDT